MDSPALGGVESLKWNENSVYLLGKTRRFRRLPGVHWHHFSECKISKSILTFSSCVTAGLLQIRLSASYVQLEQQLKIGHKLNFKEALSLARPCRGASLLRAPLPSRVFKKATVSSESSECNVDLGGSHLHKR